MTILLDPNYHLAMEWINKVKNKTNVLGSVQLGVKYANFYYEHINKLSCQEDIDHIDLQLLKTLKLKVLEDYDIIIRDCQKRVNPERDDVSDNKKMISVILDFILTLCGSMDI